MLRDLSGDPTHDVVLDNLVEDLSVSGRFWAETTGTAHASQLWGFKSEEGLGPNAYKHALFADFDLAGQKVSGAANRWIKSTTIGCVALP